MTLQLVFTESVPQSCPTVYKTERGTYVVQGDQIRDEDREELQNMLPGEDAVEVPEETLFGGMRVTDGTSKLVDPDSPEFLSLFHTFRYSAFRLETLDRYDVPVEEEAVRRFLTSGEVDTTWVQQWLDIVSQATAAGKRMQRVHIMSEPPTDYMRYELAYYPFTVAAGEDVRLLPRADTVKLDLPGRDFWLFDSSNAALLRLDKEGKFYGVELSNDPRVIARCCFWRDVALHHAVPFGRYVERDAA
jgi:hypothetical protein